MPGLRASAYGVGTTSPQRRSAGPGTKASRARRAGPYASAVRPPFLTFLRATRRTRGEPIAPRAPPRLKPEGKPGRRAANASGRSGRENDGARPLATNQTASTHVGLPLLPPPAREASGGEGRLAQSPSGVGGASPRRFVDGKARLSMAALAQPPRRSRRHLASPSRPPPLLLPAIRFASGAREEVRARADFNRFAAAAGA